MANDFFHFMSLARLAISMKKQSFIFVILLSSSLLSCTGGVESSIEYKDDNSSPTVNAAAPDSISDLIYWYNSSSSQVVSFANKAISLLPVKNYGSTLTVLSGKSGPTLVDWGDGLSKGLQFSSASNTALYANGNSSNMTENITFILVVKDLSNGDLLKWSSDLNSIVDSAVISKSSNSLDSIHALGSSDYSKNSVELASNTTPQILTVVFSSSSHYKEMYIYLNGFRIKATTGISLGSPQPYAFNLRHFLLGQGTSHGNFTLGELTAYKRALGPREVYAISKYLGEKWKIEIASSLNAEIIDDKVHEGDKVLTYESIRRDIFTPKGCLNCHSGTLANDGVNLSTYEATIQSLSSYGRVAIPGQPDSSRLYISISGTTPTMPQLETQYGGFLSAAQQSEVRQWILEGLKKNDLTPPLPLE